MMPRISRPAYGTELIHNLCTDFLQFSAENGGCHTPPHSPNMRSCKCSRCFMAEAIPQRSIIELFECFC